MGDGRWELGARSRELGDGRWEMEAGRWKQTAKAPIQPLFVICYSEDDGLLTARSSPKPSRRLTLPLVHLFCSLLFGLPQSGVIQPALTFLVLAIEFKGFGAD